MFEGQNFNIGTAVIAITLPTHPHSLHSSLTKTALPCVEYWIVLRFRNRIQALILETLVKISYLTSIVEIFFLLIGGSFCAK